VNRTFERWLGRPREDLLEQTRFQDLLTAGGRIYYETHYAPLLQMQGEVREIAVDILRSDGTVLPALINSVLRRDADGRPRVIRTTVFDATDRRGYEQELLRATRREHEIAQALQHSLLAGEAPASEAFELAVFYAPAARGLEVGGDWYDAFWVNEPQTVALVVGDVVGRGLAAAATMGQLRSAVRALASLDLRPARLLDALDGYSRRHDVGVMTTVSYAELDVETRELCFGCAGHLPPLILEPDEAPRFVWEGRSPPINSYSGSEGHLEASVTLEPGTTLLFYTDGLVEHRGRMIDEGLAELARALADHLAENLQDTVQSIVSDLRDPGHADDRCLVAVRLCLPG
jgi:PAS domain S-box-containing protein